MVDVGINIKRGVDNDDQKKNHVLKTFELAYRKESQQQDQHD